jgi:hypothetical protein
MVEEKGTSLGLGRMRYIIIKGTMLKSPRRARGFRKGIQVLFGLRTMKRFAQAINIIEAKG